MAVELRERLIVQDSPTRRLLFTSPRSISRRPSRALAITAAACGGGTAEESTSPGGQATQSLSGTIRIDGSSTVAPLSEAAAELFQTEHKNVQVTVGTSGTGGGFEKFCRGETDIST